MFHVEHFSARSPLPRGGFCLCCALSPGGAGVLGEAFESKLPFPFSGRHRGCGKFCAGWPRHRPPSHAAFRTRCTRTAQRVRSEAHYAAAAPRLARLTPGGGPGKVGQCAALPYWSFDSDQGNTTRLKRSPGLPTQCASERTLFFLLKSVRDAACGRDGPGEALQSKLPGSFFRAARGAGSFARGGRVTVRRRTRRFRHAALAPCSVFALRRTTRRQRRVWLGWHRAAGREKWASAPPCLTGLLIQTRETPPG